MIRSPRKLICRPNRWLRILAGPAGYFCSLALGVQSLLAGQPASPAGVANDHKLGAIACLGRIEPEGEILRLAAPFSLQSPPLLAELRVREGDRVVQKQIIAITHLHRLLETAWQLAEAQVKVAQRRLARVEAGEKAGEIAAAKAELQRLQAELANGEREFRRHQSLYSTGAISISEFDKTKTLLETQSNRVEWSSQKLGSIAEVRKIDVDLAAAEVEVAAAAAARAKVEFELTFIRSPIDGQVVKIHVRPGEQVGANGIVELARTDSMFVNAEVYETDISRVKKGQRAEITAESFPGLISGTVEQIGLQIAKNDLLKTDPTAYSDARVVEVKIRLADGQRVAGLIHAQVHVRILP